jgi:hypothetical protein
MLCLEFSSVAGVTIQKLLNFVLRNESPPEFHLVLGRLIRHVIDFVAGSNMPLRLAVTVQAPLHLERLCFVDLWHLIYAPVTTRASYSLVDMNAVVEVHEIGKVVNSNPLNRLTAPVTLTYRLERRTVDPDLRVAAHAGMRWRYTGE